MRAWECDLQTIAMNMSVHFTILSTVFVACSWEQARLGEGCCMWRLQLMCCIAILPQATHSHTQLSFLSIPLIIPRIWLLICWSFSEIWCDGIINTRNGATPLLGSHYQCSQWVMSCNLLTTSSQVPFQGSIPRFHSKVPFPGSIPRFQLQLLSNAIRTKDPKKHDKEERKTLWWLLRTYKVRRVCTIACSGDHYRSSYCTMNVISHLKFNLTSLKVCGV